MPSAPTPDPTASNPPTPTPLPEPTTPPPQDPPPPTTAPVKSPPLPLPNPPFPDDPMPPPQPAAPPAQHPPHPTSQPAQPQAPAPAQNQHQQHQQHQTQQQHPAPPSHPTPAASNNPRPSQPRRAPTSRRPSTRSTRVGRPPNINENCLMRRLECVMAVESGRMTMLTACQQYDISARTFYRWLRDKHRLIELTGFTEDDFRNNPPWSTPTDSAAAQDPEGGELVHDPNQQEEVDVQENLPRLSAQAGGRARGGPGGFMGMKRRFPKGSEARGAAYGDGGGGAFRGAANAQQVYYARRAFTKMPSKNVARASRREGWEEGEGGFVEGGYGEFGGDNESAFKRRKVVRDGAEEGADGDEEMPGEVDEFANGNADYGGGRRGAPRMGGMGGDKHRIEIMMGRRKVAIAWYEDAGAADIKAAIARRFALLPGTQWALMDKNLDEIVISAGVPSGRYTLTVFS